MWGWAALIIRSLEKESIDSRHEKALSQVVSSVLDPRRAAQRPIQTRIEQSMETQRQVRNDGAVDQGMSLTVTINLSSGATKTHRYDLGGDPEELKAFIDRWFDQLHAALRRETSVLALLFPTVLYNLDHIASIEIAPNAKEDLRHIVDHANARIGFLKDK